LQIAKHLRMYIEFGRQCSEAQVQVYAIFL
jgi:hypothetical protein